MRLLPRIQEVDLADEFLKLCIMKARANGETLRFVSMAKEAVAQRQAHALVAHAAHVDSWTQTLTPWLRYSGVQREAFEADVRKAAVSIGTTFDSAFAEPLVALTTLQQAFFRSLRNISMTDMLMEYVMPVGPNVKFSVTTGTGTGNIAAEAYWMPVTKINFGGEQTTPSKALGLFVVSEDVVRMGGEQASNFISAEMRNMVALATDQVTAGILTASLTPISSTGDPRKDLRKALEAINLSQWSKPCVFVSPAMLKEMANYGTGSNPPVFPDLQVPNGGSIAGMPCAAIDVLASYSGLGSPASDCMLVVDAAQCAGDAGTMDLLASNDASLLMGDAPTNGSPENEPAAATLVSMFQTNSVAFRATRWFNLSRARTTAAAVVSGCSYAVS